MQIFDLIYDKSAYIEGLVIGKTKEYNIIFWNNGIIGFVKDDDEDIEIREHTNYQLFEIDDILHTGHHGVEYESKVGKKYDIRRNKIALVNMDEAIPGKMVTFTLFDKNEFKNIDDSNHYISNEPLYTTSFEKIYVKNEFTYFRTLNSIYKFKKI